MIALPCKLHTFMVVLAVLVVQGGERTQLVLKSHFHLHHVCFLRV
jgi:hypothetical protein